jgi:hypothetical protein
VVACIERHQELEPAAEIGLLVDLARVLLLIIGQRGRVDGHRSLQRELEHVVSSAEDVATRTEIDVTEVPAIGQQVSELPAGSSGKPVCCAAASLDVEVIGNVHEEDEMIREAQVPSEVTGQMPVHDRRGRSRASLFEDQRVIVVVHVDHESETLVALAIGGARRKAVRGELGGSELVQIDLRRLRGGAGSDPEHAKKHGQLRRDPTPVAHL